MFRGGKRVVEHEITRCELRMPTHLAYFCDTLLMLVMHIEPLELI
jgi:hypothetical protein